MQLSQLNWRQARQNTGKVVVIPLGAQEQHGHHLPLATDALIGGEIARRAETILSDETLFMPMLWLGCSPHHLAFSGTVSVNGPTYIQIIRHGAKPDRRRLSAPVFSQCARRQCAARQRRFE